MNKPNNGMLRTIVVSLIVCVFSVLLTLAVAPDSNSEAIEETAKLSRDNERAIAVLVSEIRGISRDISEIKADVKDLVKEKP